MLVLFGLGGCAEHSKLCMVVGAITAGIVLCPLFKHNGSCGGTDHPSYPHHHLWILRSHLLLLGGSKRGPQWHGPNLHAGCFAVPGGNDWKIDRRICHGARGQDQLNRKLDCGYWTQRLPNHWDSSGQAASGR